MAYSGIIGEIMNINCTATYINTGLIIWQIPHYNRWSTGILILRSENNDHDNPQLI